MSRLVFFIVLSSLSGCLFFDSSNSASSNNLPKNDASNDDVSKGPDISSELDALTDLVDPPCPNELIEGECEPCGNGIIEDFEDCDYMALTKFRSDEDTCIKTDTRYQSGLLGCDNTCKFDFKNCDECGDGLRTGAEICDGTNFANKVSCDEPTRLFGEPICDETCAVNRRTCRRAFTKVSVGEVHACAIMTDRKVQCWGNNTKTPTNVNMNNGFIEIAVSNPLTCGLRNNGSVLCWTPAGGTNELFAANEIGKISAGVNHHCFLKTDGTVECLGLRTNASGAAIASIEVNLAGVTELASGLGFTCGLRSNTIVCAVTEDAEPPKTPTGNNYTDLFSGNGYVCGLFQEAFQCPAGINGLPTAKVIQIDGGLSGIRCWIKPDKTVNCNNLTPDVPNFEFSYISVGSGGVACGIIGNGLREGEIVCGGALFSSGDPASVNGRL